MRSASCFVQSLANAAEAVEANVQPLLHLCRIAKSLEDKQAMGDPSAAQMLAEVEAAARTSFAEAVKTCLPEELNITKHARYDALFKQRADLVAQTRRLA